MIDCKHVALLDSEDRSDWQVPTDSIRPQLRVGDALLRLYRERHRTAATPKGFKQPVLVLPGFLAGDTSTAVLRQHLKKRGYAVTGWKRGMNLGFVKTQIELYKKRVKKLADREGQPVHLIGSSLGGFLAREIARDCPDVVAQVISIGSPIVGGPKYTRAARFYRRASINLDRIERDVDARRSVAIKVPLTLIFSKCDGVVAWQACIDTQHDHAEHHEINIPHSSMCFSPEVFRVVSEKLAAVSVDE